MSPSPHVRAKGPSRFTQWRARMSEWMVRSSRAFLLGIVVACGVEVLIDWNQTLVEINVLRNAIRQKAESYVGILGKAGDDELQARDHVGLERLSHGIFDDEDAVYVRFTDATGAVVWDKLKPDFVEAFRARGNPRPFEEQYGGLMTRDTERALHDPQGLEDRVANSRYRDFAQVWTDTTARVVAAFSPPPPPGSHRGLIVYEDRLHDENRQRDDKISYAIATMLGEQGETIGTVIVAFDMLRTNKAVRFKYLKFAGLCSFFVALILVQNIVSRRTKLRLLDLEAAYTEAKRALREAMPQDVVRCPPLSVRGAVEQAKGLVDGMLWTAAAEDDSVLVLTVDPDGDGVDAAAVGLHVAKTFEARRRHAGTSSLEDELRALGAAAEEIPLTRPLGAALVRVHAETGEFRALLGTGAQLRIVGGNGVTAPELRPRDEDAPEGIHGPLFEAAGTLEAGRSLVVIFADASRGQMQSYGDGIARQLAREGEKGTPMTVHEAAVWARARTAADSDVAIVTVTRDP